MVGGTQRSCEGTDVDLKELWGGVRRKDLFSWVGEQQEQGQQPQVHT